ncbi:hypothetical protein Trco_003487 [Trichoderma cornu-damae]|uniref:Uncharacterized protein n=1 Tax=Trichoderma cornu-damae TaxID=654480 RepID=A0A9P8TW14_9HYPO|nr:hypothetical protein Trco_003487 [Trichoderma cornu-damae]
MDRVDVGEAAALAEEAGDGRAVDEAHVQHDGSRLPEEPRLQGDEAVPRQVVQATGARNSWRYSAPCRWATCRASRQTRETAGGARLFHSRKEGWRKRKGRKICEGMASSHMRHLSSGGRRENR